MLKTQKEDNKLKNGLVRIKSLPCSLPFSNDKYEHPTPEEVKFLIESAGWTQREVAMIVGVNYTVKGGSPTIRRWKADIGSSSHRMIPYASWRLLLLSAGCARY